MHAFGMEGRYAFNRDMHHAGKALNLIKNKDFKTIP